jgi:hypothetical protein
MLNAIQNSAAQLALDELDYYATPAGDHYPSLEAESLDSPLPEVKLILLYGDNLSD